MIRVQTPRDRDKLERQIKALECLLSQDTDDVSRDIHRRALEASKRALNACEGI